MQNKKLQQYTTTACVMLIAAGLFLNSCNHHDPDPKNIKASKSVNAREITEALTKSGSKKIIMNIYPVKLSSDMEKNDFDINILLQDSGGVGKNPGSNIDEKKFMQQSTWYIDYLKEHKLSKDKIPYGYYLEIDSSIISGKSGLNISVLPLLSQLQYCLTPAEMMQGDTPQSKEKDSTGNCNGCCPTAQYMRADSGRCPPCTLILGSNMKTLIAAEYK